MLTADRYAHLVKRSKRTSDDWSARLGPSLMKDLIALGALESVDRSELDGFEGRFDVNGELQEFRLHLSPDAIIADPLEGGSSIVFNQANLIFMANPEKLLKKIAEASGFSLCKPHAGQSPMVTCLERIIESKIFKALIVLDASWLGSFGARAFVEDSAKGAESIALFVDAELACFPWDIAGKIDRRVDHIPCASDGWRISRAWYCDPRLGISTQRIATEYPEIKIVFDEVNTNIVILGHHVKLKAHSRPYNFFRGLCLMGENPMAADMFAHQYLGYHEDDANEITRAARTQAGNAIENAISDPFVMALAFRLCMPDTPKKTVRSGFKPDDILIFRS